MNTSNVLSSSTDGHQGHPSHNGIHDHSRTESSLPWSSDPVAPLTTVEPVSDPPQQSLRPVRFKVRIADLDYSMAVPGPLDMVSCQFLPPHIPVLKVPVMRIYGANEAGQKTCLHVHQAYPYFFVPYKGSLELQQLQNYIHQLGVSINHAASIIFKAPIDLRKSQYVAAIIPVKGIPFYGYHVGYSYFLKIYLFNPDHQTRIVDLLRSGAVMGTHFQPFEAHVPFKPQFFADFNLYGMGWIELEDALLRNHVPDAQEGDHPNRLTKATVANMRIWARENDPGRISHCEIEMDTTVDRILNRDRAPERDTHQSLGECFQSPPTAAQVPSMAGLWEDDARRRKASNLPSQEPPKTQVRDDDAIPWLTEETNKQLLQDLLKEMMQQSQTNHQPGADFETFEIKEDPLGASFMTAYGSVDFICPRTTFASAESAATQSQSNESFDYYDGETSIVVDESIISQSADEFMRADEAARKGTLSVLGGLGDIEEDEGEDDFSLPDLDGFDERDFEDAEEEREQEGEDEEEEGDLVEGFDGDKEFYEGMDGEELEAASEHGSQSPKSPAPFIPQYDGGGDSVPRGRKTKNSPEAEWKTITAAASKRKGRSGSSSSLIPQSKAISTKRFCEIVTNTSRSASSTLAHATSSTLQRRPIQKTASERTLVHHVQNTTSKWRGKQVIDCVDIPVRLVPPQTNAVVIEIPKRKQPERTRFSPKVALLADDLDEIEDTLDEDSDSEPGHLGGAMTLEEIRDQSGKDKLAFDFPAPASPERSYFMATMDDLWSSPSPPLSRPAFIHSPPRPTSPDSMPTAAAKAIIPSGTLPEHRNHGLVEEQGLDEPMDTGYDLDDAMDVESHTVSPSLGAWQDQPSTEPVVQDSLIQEQAAPQPWTGGLVSGSLQYSIPPPTTESLMESLVALGLPNVVHQKPYFSKEADVPTKTKVFGGKEFRLQSNGIKTMKPFKSALDENTEVYPGKGFRFWEPNARPPSSTEISQWLEEEKERAKARQRSLAEASTQQRREKISQIEGPTQKNPFGCKNSPIKVAGSVAVEKDFLDLLSVEVHCQTRAGLLPDPKHDPILAVFYCWQADREGLFSNGWAPGYHVGVMTHAESGMMEKLALESQGYHVQVAENERDLLECVIQRVRELDPDILVGYEVHNLSWGYLVDRYQTLLSLDMSKLLSRICPPKIPVLSKSALEAKDTFNSQHNAGLRFSGRHLFNVWRLIRNEVALTNYGFCNVVFHLLQQRVPSYSHETLTKWWVDGSALQQERVLRHYIHRVQYNLQLLESQEVVSRTAEFARVFGVDFYSVISRGSQFKVESLMVRLAKPENFIMITPSRAQVGGQRAAEHIPMIMEPESGFYEDPVVVLDFQSLYPSVMIAYNYCYSTCLGKLGGGTKLGVTEYEVQDGIIPLVQNHLQLAPNNVMYVNREIRRSLLARLLAEILDTRVMVKKAMKEYPNNRSLLKLLEARQLGLKYLANVTYGYTNASYSGRMPGIEIADSIVLSARETLERAIRFVNDHPKWNARVIYGDTDSMFVHLKGRTRQEAFEIGYDISETITRMNPRPVKLKFEKVYHPCFLVTKKRYVGSSYETPTQVEPIFDAKGIETIRRDGVPAVQKIMETCIKTMFRTQDLTQVKAYLVRQLAKILEGRIPVPDLMFGKEVRLGGYSEKGVPPPGAVVSARRMELDPRSEPQYGERVPYVVVYGDPDARLTDQVVEPKELLKNRDLRLNGEYYIRKHILPSLARIFQLAGADVASWYDEMPRLQRATPLSGLLNPPVPPPQPLDEAPVASASKMETGGVNEEDKDGNEANLGSGTDPGSVGPPPVGPPPVSKRFKPRRKGGKGFVSIGARIDRYYQSQLCVICDTLVSNRQKDRKVHLCEECSGEQGRVKSMFTLQNRLAKAERLFRATVDVCSSCCRASPNGGAGVAPTFDRSNMGKKSSSSPLSLASQSTGLELVACESLECSVFWQRQKAQDGVLVAQHQTARVVQELEDMEDLFGPDRRDKDDDDNDGEVEAEEEVEEEEEEEEEEE